MNKMDPEAKSVPVIDAEDNWDTEGFEIPNLSVDESEIVENSLSLPEVNKIEEKQPDPINNVSLKRKQKLKQKLKEADEKFVGKTGRENKVEVIKEFLGENKGNYNNALQKGSGRDWLDPHCNESEFERKSN